MRGSWLWLILIVAGLLAGMAATDRLSAPPQARTLQAPGSFDAGRAKARLVRVLGDETPHPADTAASDGVRDRLVAELRGMGLQPRVDDRFTCNGLFKQRGVACARVRNILVTLGPATGKHLLINSHYDSVPVGPGASDAGLGVATMLEVAAQLRDRPLARPVTLLFNEGEELGLVGARAFLDGDPLSRQVDSLINLEARGTTGPVNMFETSLPNAAAVRLFDDFVETPVASSLAVSAYRQLPNYTDVNSFEERGWLTLNFAPIGNETRYHSPGDNLAAVDLATLQHMGDQTLSLATQLASAPAPAQIGGEWLFMTLPFIGLLILPMWAGVVATAVLGLAFLVVVARRRAWLGLPLFVIAVALGTGLAWLGLTVLGSLREGQFWRAQPQWSELAVYASVIAATLAVLALARRSEARQLRAAWWLLFLIVGAAISAVASGGLIYFLLPPFVAALGLLLGRWWRPAEVVAALIAALLAWLTIGGMLGLLEEMLSGGPLWLFAPLGALVMIPWLIEAKPLLEEPPRGGLLAGALALAVLAWVPAALAPAYSDDRQQQWTLQYVIDPAARQPVWSIVNDRKALPAELSQFGDWRFGTLPLGSRRRWIAPAPPVAGLVPARAIPLGQTAVPGGRHVRFRIEANGADSVALVAPEQARVIALGAPGQLRRIDAAEGSGPYQLSCTGRSCDGQLLEMTLGPQAVELLVIGTRWTLPAAAAPLKAAQPDHARAQYLPDATILLSRLRI